MDEEKMTTRKLDSSAGRKAPPRVAFSCSGCCGAWPGSCAWLPPASPSLAAVYYVVR